MWHDRGVQAPCHKTKNPAFINPSASTPQAMRAAKKMCEHCPLLKECARAALTSGTSLDGSTIAPANDVFQAGVHCTGDYQTAVRLSLICGDPIPAGIEEPTTRTRPKPPSNCVHCHRPMVQWNRFEEQPEGYVMHYAKGFCQKCRAAYQSAYPPRRHHQRGLRKEIDRKRHSAPPRKRGALAVQQSLF